MYISNIDNMIEEPERDENGNPKCPSCGKVIASLYLRTKAEVGADFMPNGKVENVNIEEVISYVEFACPYCGKVITETNEEALNFLNEDD